MQTQELIVYYSSLLWRKLPLLLLGTVLCSGITFLVCVYMPPVYQATALVRVTIATTTTNDDVFGAQASAVDYALLLDSPDVLHAITQKEPDMSSVQLQQVISAAPVDNTQIIQISAQASSAQKASMLANVTATIFVQVESSKEAARVQNAISLLAPHIIASKDNLNDAQQQLSHLQGSGASLAQISQEQSIVDSDQANYNQLVANMGLLQVQKLQANVILSVVQSANTPLQPISPRTAQSTTISVFLGFCLTVMLVLLADWFDVTIKTADEARRLLHTGSVAVIPYDHQQNLRHLLHNGVVIADQNVVHDAYVVLCAYLLHARQSWPRCLMVTSPDQGVGTTTAAVLLATLMAQSGKRVLLIDANLFRPALHDVFQVSNARGIVNGLDAFWGVKDRRDQDLSVWLERWKTVYPNLWLLPTGPAIGRTDALLELVDLLYRLKDEVFGITSGHNLLDLLIIDAPAFTEDGVMPSLASLADEMLLVAATERTRSSALLHATRFFSNLQVPCVATILNSRRIRKHVWLPALFRLKNSRVSEIRDVPHVPSTSASLSTTNWQVPGPIETGQKPWPMPPSSLDQQRYGEIAMQKPLDRQDTMQMAFAGVAADTDYDMPGLLESVATTASRSVSDHRGSAFLPDSEQGEPTHTTLHVPVTYPNTAKLAQPNRSILVYPSPLAISLTGVRPEENKRPLLARAVSSPSLQAQQSVVDTHPLEQDVNAMELDTPSPISLPGIKAEIQDLMCKDEENSQLQQRFQFTSLLRKGRVSFEHSDEHI